MRKITALSVMVAVILGSSSLARARDLGVRELGVLKSPTCSSCGKETYGTAIRWEGSPAAAARKAKQEKKLVFVLHVSGHFEDAAFT